MTTNTLTILRAALEAMEANHNWHLNFDTYEGYPGSDLWTDSIESISNLRTLIATIKAQPVEDDLVNALASIRDMFPVPAHGEPIERDWSAAMAEPEHVPAYVRACLARVEAQPVQEPVGMAGNMPGTSGFTMTVFEAAKIPVGTKLYAAPVQPVEQPSGTAKAIHYPECWDTAAYPTLAHALHEMTAGFKCTNDDCLQPVEQPSNQLSGNSGTLPVEQPADLIPQDALFVCGQMGAHVTRVTVEQPKAVTPPEFTEEELQPLTDDQMWSLWNSQGVDEMIQHEAIAFARAIERAHGIGGEQ